MKNEKRSSFINKVGARFYLHLLHVFNQLDIFARTSIMKINWLQFVLRIFDTS